MKELDMQLERLGNMQRASIRQKVVEHLTENREPMDTHALALELELPFLTIQRAVCDLVAVGRLVRVATTCNGRPAYRPVEIGTCEWCGLLDHHLVAGECPRCAERIAGTSTAASR
jgi:hypothetical protein